MKKVPLRTEEFGNLVVSGSANVEITEDFVFLVSIDVYPGSALARRLAEKSSGSFSLDLSDSSIPLCAHGPQPGVVWEQRTKWCSDHNHPANHWSHGQPKAVCEIYARANGCQCCPYGV